MNFLIALFIGAIVAYILGCFKLSNYVTFSEPNRSGDRTPTTHSKGFVRLILSVVLFIIIWAVSPIGIQRIDAGNVGLKVDRIGNDKGIPVAQPCKGWVFYNTWTTDVIEYSIRQFHVEYKAFEIAAKGGTPIPVQPSFNIYLKSEKAVEVYIHLLKGADLESLKDNWLSNATILALKNATNRFTPDSIFNHSDQYQIAVRKELESQVGKYFDIDNQLNPGQMPPASMKGILQSKANAVQAAQQAELDRQTAVAKAQQKIAEARGDSAQAVISASGRAEAIKKEQSVLTPTYVEFIRWSKWDGKLPTTMLGNNSTTLFQQK